MTTTVPLCRFEPGDRIVVESAILPTLTGFWGHVADVCRYFDQTRGHFVRVALEGHRDDARRLPIDVGHRTNDFTMFERELSHVD